MSYSTDVQRSSTRIATKGQMYRMLQAGKFGNTIRMWNSVEEIKASGYQGLISARAQKVGDPIKLYHLTLDEIEGNPKLKSRRDIVYSEAPPDHKRTIQGELQRGPWGWYLFYSFVPLPMRFALAADGRHATGLAAKRLLEHYLDPASLDDLYELLDTYPDAVVEFSSFSVPVGTVPGRQTLIWEVRHY